MIKDKPLPELVVELANSHDGNINQLERFLNNGVNQIIQVSVSTIIIGIIFFYISPLIASIAIVPVPIIFLDGVSIIAII